MTGGACTRACQAAGYTLAGTEYGQECWCGNSFLNGGAPASDGCNMACKGDPSSVSTTESTLSNANSSSSVEAAIE